MNEHTTITIQVKLLPTKKQEQQIDQTMKNYVSTVNSIVNDFGASGKTDKRTSKDIPALLPSCLKNQAILDAKSIFKKHTKKCQKTAREKQKNNSGELPKVFYPVLRKPVAIWNNQNYSVNAATIGFPVFVDGKSTKTYVKAMMPTDLLERLEGAKRGTLRITPKGDKLIAQIAVGQFKVEPSVGGSMGVDLGLKIPAVCVTESGKVHFVGNGRKNKYLKRKFRAERKRLGKAKKRNAIRKSRNREQRIMRDVDHKISREIVNFAKNDRVSVIRMERLTNIRATARTSRKNANNLHAWSFYRLAQYIEYKAELAGIRVEYVDPAYTSQKCPVCGNRNHAKDRQYQCGCGYKGHRDIVGAINIRKAAPVVDGNSLPA